jgi:DNA mismatch repair protein MutS
MDSISEKSFVDARDLRHVLIEHLQQQEIYVPNDICLGKKEIIEETNTIDGILLYGTNAVGKTSFIRALGIAIIMAQSGMYVPCSKFIYKPYTAIYSRILGNDNLFKGLSTFAVEMSELRVILKNADKNSFILGDELCSGTETESALSIFMASLQELDKKDCSYIFATHFHEVLKYDELLDLQKRERITIKHLEVWFDREKQCLVYDRKLKSGAGTRNYGLEVCKSLFLSEHFLERAYNIRNKYYPENQGFLTHNESRYNSKKIRGVCEMCNTNIGEEIHHMYPQEMAESGGYISTEDSGVFHKNHPANLMSICEKCHLNMHHPTSLGDSSVVSELSDTTSSATTTKTKRIIRRKKTTKGYTLQEVVP